MMRRFIECSTVEARINVTPIIDVALVLVIILLITGSMLTVAELGLVLPKARTVSIADEHRISVSLGRDGRIAIGERFVPRDGFVRALSAELAERTQENPLVIVRADSSTSHGVVKSVLDDAAAAGAMRIAFATSPPTEKLP